MERTEPVEESIHIQAPPARVFEYFTDPAALVEWMGESAELEPRPGGRFVVTVGGETIRGQYVVVDPPRRLRITWGRDGSAVLPPGSTEIDVSFEDVDGGTVVTLVHRALPGHEVDRHRQGWRHYLSNLPGLLPVARKGPQP